MKSVILRPEGGPPPPRRSPWSRRAPAPKTELTIPVHYPGSLLRDFLLDFASDLTVSNRPCLNCSSSLSS